MTIQEYIDANPVDDRGKAMTYAKVRYLIKMGRIAAYKDGGGWELNPDADPKTVQAVQAAKKSQAGGSLKDKLTAMQIKKIQQQLETGRRAIREEAIEETLEMVAECLVPLREELGALRLDRKTLARLRAALDGAVKRIEKNKKGG